MSFCKEHSDTSFLNVLTVGLWWGDMEGRVCSAGPPRLSTWRAQRRAPAFLSPLAGELWWPCPQGRCGVSRVGWRAWTAGPVGSLGFGLTPSHLPARTGQAGGGGGLSPGFLGQHPPQGPSSSFSSALGGQAPALQRGWGPPLLQPPGGLRGPQAGPPSPPRAEPPAPAALGAQHRTSDALILKQL